jgi:UDP-GlcNAc:undecaprenyl-phosphate GlcNAc-1-phosphate transferase
LPILAWSDAEPGFAMSLLAVGLVLVTGAVDDARPLPPVVRLVAQAFAVALVLWAGVRFGAVPLAGLDVAPWWLAGPATALLILANTNAVNLADGLDGLAGGLVVPTLLAIALLASQGNGGATAIVCAALIGGVLGFLRFNTYPASVFLGDAGSTFLGFTAAVLAIQLVQACNPALNPAIVPLLLGVPLLDTVYAILRRLVAGQALFAADRRHLHHQLLGLGLSQPAVVAVLYLLQGAMVLVAVLFRYESDLVLLGAFALIALAAIVPLATISIAGRPTLAPGGPASGAAAAQGLERRNLWLRRRSWLPQGALSAVKFGVAGLIVTGSLMPAAIPTDVAVVAIAIAGLCLAMAMVLPPRSLAVRRLVIYAAAGFAAYLVVASTTAAGKPVLGWVVGVYLAALAGVLLVAIRVTRREQFRVTPQDILVLFLAFAIPNFSAEALAQYHLREVVAIVIVLFYATEFVLAKDRDARRGLDLTAFLALAVIGVRGFIQG